MGGNILLYVNLNLDVYDGCEDEPHVCDCQESRVERDFQSQRRCHMSTGRESENGVIHLLGYPFDVVRTTPPKVRNSEY